MTQLRKLTPDLLNGLTMLNYDAPAEFTRAVLINKFQGQTIKEQLEADKDGTRQSLGKMIFGLAEIYTTAKMTDANGITETARLVVAECINILATRYKAISAADVREAFRSAAAGEIDVNLAAYNSKFTPVMFGDVLKAYKAKRDRILAQHSREVMLLESRKADAEAEQKNAKTLSDCVELLEHYKMHAPTFDEIPEYLGRILYKNGVISTPNADKVKIYAAAKKEAVKQLKSELIAGNVARGQEITIKRQLIQALKLAQNGDDAASLEFIRRRANVIYSKMIVLYYLKNF